MNSIFRGVFLGGLLLAAPIFAGCSKAPMPAGQESEVGKPEKSVQTPTLKWPPRFSPSLDIRIATPKVPDKIRGPSPPIAEKKP